MAPSVARESTWHCKLDSQLYWAVVRSMFEVSGKWIMEIPAQAWYGPRISNDCSVRLNSWLRTCATMVFGRELPNG